MVPENVTRTLQLVTKSASALSLETSAVATLTNAPPVITENLLVPKMSCERPMSVCVTAASMGATSSVPTLFPEIRSTLLPTIELPEMEM